MTIKLHAPDETSEKKIKKIKKTYKVEIFHVNNSSDKWALIIDGFYQLLEKNEAAEELYKKACGEEDWDSTPFGCICLVPPKYIAKNILGEIASDDVIFHEQINLECFIDKRYKRSNQRSWTKKNEDYQRILKDHLHNQIHKILNKKASLPQNKNLNELLNSIKNRPLELIFDWE